MASLPDSGHRRCGNFNLVDGNAALRISHFGEQRELHCRRVEAGQIGCAMIGASVQGRSFAEAARPSQADGA
jgi:hypothetical protein